MEERERKAPSGGRPADGGDHRLVEGVDGEHVPSRAEPVGVAFDHAEARRLSGGLVQHVREALRRLAVFQLGQVTTRAPRRPVGGRDDGTHAVVYTRLFERLHVGDEQRTRQPVERRIVQTELEDGAVPLPQDQVTRHRRPPRCTRGSGRRRSCQRHRAVMRCGTPGPARSTSAPARSARTRVKASRTSSGDRSPATAGPVPSAKRATRPPAALSTSPLSAQSRWTRKAATGATMSGVSSSVAGSENGRHDGLVETGHRHRRHRVHQNPMVQRPRLPARGSARPELPLAPP